MELDIKQISLFIVIFSQLILLSECVNSSVIEEIYNSIKSLPEYEQLGKYLYVQWKDNLLFVQWKDHLLAHTSLQMLNLWLFYLILFNAWIKFNIVQMKGCLGLYEEVVLPWNLVFNPQNCWDIFQLHNGQNSWKCGFLKFETEWTHFIPKIYNTIPKKDWYW